MDTDDRLGEAPGHATKKPPKVGVKDAYHVFTPTKKNCLVRESIATRREDKAEETEKTTPMEMMITGTCEHFSRCLTPDREEKEAEMAHGKVVAK